MLPALANFAEFVLDFCCLVVLAGPGQALPHNLQLLLVLLSYADLLLVVLGEKQREDLKQRHQSSIKVCKLHYI